MSVNMSLVVIYSILGAIYDFFIPLLHINRINTTDVTNITDGIVMSLSKHL